MIFKGGRYIGQYRWIALWAAIIFVLNNWLDNAFLDPLAQLLLLIFVVFYWRDHKDTFSIILLICASIILVLGIVPVVQNVITYGIH